MTIRSEFWIHCAKEIELSNLALDWFIKSLKFKYKSDEWMICRLKEKIYMKQAMKHSEAALKYLHLNG